MKQDKRGKGRAINTEPNKIINQTQVEQIERNGNRNRKSK